MQDRLNLGAIENTLDEGERPQADGERPTTATTETEATTADAPIAKPSEAIDWRSRNLSQRPQPARLGRHGRALDVDDDDRSRSGRLNPFNPRARRV